jgi:hypothetical protein
VQCLADFSFALCRKYFFVEIEQVLYLELRRLLGAPAEGVLLRNPEKVEGLKGNVRDTCKAAVSAT